MHEPPSLVALGRAVRDVRRERGLSQRELADELGRQRSYVGHVEQGRRNVTYSTLGRLAQALGVPMSELLRRAEAHERDLP